MHKQLKHAFQQQLTTAKVLTKSGNYSAAFAELEVAHILGQQYLLPHWQVHFAMLRVGFKQRSLKEIAGQIWRIILTPLGHLSGRLPIGNTGGSNVNAFTPMPVKPELQQLLSRDH